MYLLYCPVSALPTPLVASKRRRCLCSCCYIPCTHTLTVPGIPVQFHVSLRLSDSNFTFCISLSRVFLSTFSFCFGLLYLFCISEPELTLSASVSLCFLSISLSLSLFSRDVLQIHVLLLI